MTEDRSGTSVEAAARRHLAMILNVIDNRKLRYRWKLVNAIAEPTWHDNSYKDADQAEPTDGEVDYEEKNKVSVREAIKWADSLPFPATLYLYDVGE